MKLDLYNKKRNFSKTPEPKGIISHKHKQLFVIQKHAASHLHYDFRLELNGVLISWAVPKGPCLDPTVKRLAIHVEDHPIEYGHFEGVIPQGEYGGGTVMLWDEGCWLPLDENPKAAYLKGHLKFILNAKKLKGQWSLIRLNKDDKKSWFLIKAKDKYVKPISEYDITLEKPNSVSSQNTLEEITENYQRIWMGNKSQKSSKKKVKQKPLKIDLSPSTFPSIISPQLATLVDEAPTGDEWIHEIKFDGYRILAFKKNHQVKLMSRNNNDWTNKFSNIADQIKERFTKNIIFDGEIILLDEAQKSNFQLLQNAIGLNKHFIYYIFDLLYYDKYNLMKLPLIERKNILKKILDNTNTNTLRYSDHIIGSGKKIFNNACHMKLEGIVSKNLNSPYVEKRTKNWLKIKCSKQQEFVIGGFSPPQGSRNYFGSLFLGYYNKKGLLIFCGHVGTGFNQASLKKVYTLLKKNISKKNPFSTRPPGVTSATWVKPKLVAQIEFSEWTTEGILRHPSFKGLRTDKPAKLVTREKELPLNKIKESEPDKSNKHFNIPFKLTHPNKILYPETKITKLALAEYYTAIQEWILPYVVNRPLTLVRCPENYKNFFYQKHVNRGTPDAICGIKIKEKDKIENCIYIKNYEGLMALIQMSSLEIHPWGSRTENIEYPDTITIDLDPAPNVSWKKVVATAKRIQKHLLDFELHSFVKTTGGKGLHVVIPIQPEFNWTQVKNFAHVFVNFMVMNYPNEYVSEMSKIKRKDKIFIDYLRNQRGATAIAAYSTRARPGAPISTPLDWDELTSNIKDTFFTIDNIQKRLNNLKKDPWEKFYKIKQSLKSILK